MTNKVPVSFAATKKIKLYQLNCQYGCVQEVRGNKNSTY